jgi:thioredoxin 1
MEKDDELERIKHEKLREMMRKTERKRKPTISKPVKLTDATFKSAVQKNQLVVVDCWAPWCAPCHMVSPIIEELAREYAGKIFFGKLNVDENRNVAMQYQLMSIPTMLVFKNGELVDRILGAMPKKILEPSITRHM